MAVLSHTHTHTQPDGAIFFTETITANGTTAEKRQSKQNKKKQKCKKND